MTLFPSPPIPSADPADPSEQRALVALSLVPGVGTGRLRALLARFGSAQHVMQASPQQLVRTEGIGWQTAAAITGAECGAEVETQFRRAEEIGATLLTVHDSRYPALLREIYDPPVLLWVRGRLEPADEYAIAIVGTRKATAYGKRTAAHVARGLAAKNVTVVSGLAYGIDVAAHDATLDAGGRTIAVLGSGVDRIYPARHSGLVRAILDGDQGAVVSEFPLGTAPDAGNFPRRNRIISGMSRGTFVAEARATGGALITACMALEQNREVWAAPAPLFTPMEGTNRLIRRGYAGLATSAEDLLADLGDDWRQSAGTSQVDSAPIETIEKMSPIDLKLYSALEETPVGLDTLCDKAGVDVATALVHLLDLEFRGLVCQLAGRQFYRA